MKWLIALVVLILYVQLFNILATKYLESDRTLTLADLYRRFVPPVKITIEVNVYDDAHQKESVSAPVG
jgi:hypothetical protein